MTSPPNRTVGLCQLDWLNTTSFIERYAMLLDQAGQRVIRLSPSMPDFWDRVRELDLFIYWMHHAYQDIPIARSILPILEQLGVACLPGTTTSWHFDDKIRQYYLLSNAGFPIIKSHIFWERQAALDWLEQAELPTVFKLRGGAGSASVILIRSKAEGRRIINLMFKKGLYARGIPFGSTARRDKPLIRRLRSHAGRLIRQRRTGTTPYCEQHKNYALFQDFMPGNEFDSRITIIGDRAFGYRRLVRDNDFRSSGSGRMRYETDQINPRFVEMAFKISRHFGFQSMAYDFIYDRQGEPAICEMCHTFTDIYVYRCLGYWRPDLSFQEGHFWPEACLLQDALGADIISEATPLDQTPVTGAMGVKLVEAEQ